MHISMLQEDNQQLKQSMLQIENESNMEQFNQNTTTPLQLKEDPATMRNRSSTNLMRSLNLVDMDLFNLDETNNSARVDDLQSKLMEQNVTQKTMTGKIGLLEARLDDVQDNCQILEQENKALKETNDFLKKMNLNQRSKQKQTVYTSTIEQHTSVSGVTQTQSYVSNSFLELAEGMKNTGSDFASPQKKKEVVYDQNITKHMTQTSTKKQVRY